MKRAMGYSGDEANEAIRLSLCHLTPVVDMGIRGGKG
jgi:cysteine sulfinate desulfinase/cysteine desulfurase-like protein